jgi:hypothetical protein
VYHLGVLFVDEAMSGPAKAGLLIETLLNIVIGSHHANMTTIQNLTVAIQALAHQVRSINAQQINAPAPAPGPAASLLDRIKTS